MRVSIGEVSGFTKGKQKFLYRKTFVLRHKKLLFVETQSILPVYHTDTINLVLKINDPLCLDTIGQAQSDPVLITVFRETFRGEVELEELIIPLPFVIDVQIYGQVRVRQFLEPELYGLFRFHLILFSCHDFTEFK